MTDGSLTVAVHQPNYIPWLGYFHKVAACDLFVYLDAVQFPRGQSFGARNRIKTPNGVTFLTVPVSAPKGRKGKATYREIEFAEPRWREKHLKTVEMSYARAAYFDEVFGLYGQALETGSTPVEVNVALIEAFANYLGIETKRVLLSELVPDFGRKTDLILDVCKAVGADTYLSGAGGGKDYTDEELLADEGVSVRYDEFEPTPYPQLWGDFEPGLSALDALMNCGREARKLVA
ncbi:MAG: WbqC family protein [Gaiellaceae bacterium]